MSNNLIGHNQPSFDQIVEENLQQGFYRSHLDALARCIKDFRLEPRHRLVLVEIIEHTNSKTSMAFPGRARLAANIAYYVNGITKRYSQGTVATTISELIDFGYLMVDKRAPATGGRAMSHYVVTKPSAEELQDRIADACAAIRSAPKRAFPVADVNAGLNVKTGLNLSPEPQKTQENRSDVNDRLNVNAGLDVKTGVSADVNAGVLTVTGKRTCKEIPPKNLEELLLLPEEPPADAGSLLVDQQFEEFWSAFPPGRKHDKGSARKAFRKVVTGKHLIGRATASRLIEAAKTYSAAKPDPKYTPLPTTWLNGGRWDDDVCQPRNRPASGARADWERQLAAVAEFGVDQ